MATDTFAVTTPNAAPYIISAIPDRTAATGQAFSYTVPAFGDLNNQALSYTVTGQPAWMAFDAGTRTLSGTPTAGGTYTLTVTASDGSLTVSDSFVLTVSSTPPPNAAPIVNHPLVDQYDYMSYTFDADTFVDPNGDTLTYTTSTLPSGVTFNPATRTFSGSPPIKKYTTSYGMKNPENPGQSRVFSS